MTQPTRDTAPARPALRAMQIALTSIISAFLLFAAYSKFFYANPKLVLLDPANWTLHPKGLLLDHVVAVAEIVMVLALLVFHRRALMWAITAVLFAGFCGYALFLLLRGEPCGCFATLWEPPKGFTVVLDTVFMAAAIALAAWGGLRKPLIVLTAIGMLGAFGVGYAVSREITPPTSEQAIQHEIERTGKSPFDALLESDLLADVRADNASGTAYYLFIYDPDCHHCEMMLPIVQAKQRELDDFEDPVMRIRILTVHEIEAALGISQFAWSPTPTVVLVRNADFVRDNGEPRKTNGSDAAMPDEAYKTAYEELNELLRSGG